jgi:hypothetical protein
VNDVAYPFWFARDLFLVFSGVCLLESVIGIDPRRFRIVPGLIASIRFLLVLGESI